MNQQKRTTQMMLELKRTHWTAEKNEFEQREKTTTKFYRTWFNKTGDATPLWLQNINIRFFFVGRSERDKEKKTATRKKWEKKKK